MNHKDTPQSRGPTNGREQREQREQIFQHTVFVIFISPFSVPVAEIPNGYTGNIHLFPSVPHGRPLVKGEPPRELASGLHFPREFFRGRQ